MDPLDLAETLDSWDQSVCQDSKEPSDNPENKEALDSLDLLDLKVFQDLWDPPESTDLWVPLGPEEKLDAREKPAPTATVFTTWMSPHPLSLLSLELQSA